MPDPADKKPAPGPPGPAGPSPGPGDPAGPGGPSPAPGPAGDDTELLDFAAKIFNLARSGNEPGLAAYIDAGIPAGLTNDSGDSLLMLAAYHGHDGLVRLLVQRGADPGRPNDRGQTPLAGAVLKREPGVVQALLEAGADPDAGAPSAAATAAMFGNDDFLAWFAEYRREHGSGPPPG